MKRDDKVVFASPYLNPPIADPVPSGQKSANTYQLERDPVTNECFLRKTGEVNLYDEIQEHHDLVNLKALIKRYDNGDLTAIGDPQAVTGANTLYAPTNIVEANDIVNRFKAMYYNSNDFQSQYSTFENWIKNYDFSNLAKENQQKIEPKNEPKVGETSGVKHDSSASVPGDK